MEQEPISYPLVSILYCVKCNWVLRAAWYQQELLQTFTSKASTVEESGINSIILRPSFVSGTFKVLVKLSEHSEWIQVWDRVENGGFPEAKALKQAIRNIVSPNKNLGHSDKLSSGTLVSPASPSSKGVPVKSPAIPAPKCKHIPTKEDLDIYGSPKLAASHKTFCEECLENLPPTWAL